MNTAITPSTIDMSDDAEKTTKIIKRLLKKTSGDTVKLRKMFIKRSAKGDERAQAYLQMLTVYEAEEVAKIEEVVAEIARTDASRLESRKARYAILYPKINI